MRCVSTPALPPRPRDGQTEALGEFPNSGEREFTPPTSGENNDWVLVLEVSRRKLCW